MKIIKFKLGDEIPKNSRFLKSEKVVERVRPPEGGSYLQSVEYFYYEVPDTETANRENV